MASALSMKTERRLPWTLLSNLYSTKTRPLIAQHTVGSIVPWEKGWRWIRSQNPPTNEEQIDWIRSLLYDVSVANCLWAKRIDGV